MLEQGVDGSDSHRGDGGFEGFGSFRRVVLFHLSDEFGRGGSGGGADSSKDVRRPTLYRGVGVVQHFGEAGDAEFGGQNEDAFGGFAANFCIGMEGERPKNRSVKLWFRLDAAKGAQGLDLQSERGVVAGDGDENFRERARFDSHRLHGRQSGQLELPVGSLQAFAESGKSGRANFSQRFRRVESDVFVLIA